MQTRGVKSKEYRLSLPGRVVGRLGEVAQMETLFELVDKGVRIAFLPCLREKWLYFARPQLLLMDEQISDDDRADAEREVRSRLRE